MTMNLIQFVRNGKVACATQRLLLGCLSGLLIISCGCFTAWVSPTQRIAPPASKIAPTVLDEPSPPTSRNVSADPKRSVPPPAGLLTAPLPSDLPQIPFSKE